jgi:type I restriction enzyme R subunit
LSFSIGKEDFYAEQPTLQWLEEADWTRVYGPDIAPDGKAPERKEWSDVVLKERLRIKVAELNPELPRDQVDLVVQEAVSSGFPDQIQDHEAFHKLLVDGVPVSWTDENGVDRNIRADLVDFDDPSNNEYLAINQFTIIIGKKNRRPDVLLFINGVPLAEIELKNPTDQSATPETAVNQVQHYLQTIPDLYRFVEIVGISDLLQARVGTITTPAEHFAEWKTMDPADSEGMSSLEVMIREAFSPENLLDLIQNFVLFEVGSGGLRKIMAKYHQVDAVRMAAEASAKAQTDDGRAGVVWHTQGAGKTYTMAFYVLKVRRDPRFANPTIVALTDRRDLDDQLRETFAAIPELSAAVKEAKEIKNGPDSLYELLKVPAGGIVHTTIQKFGVAKGEEIPVLSERSNVIVMADEAHRSQDAGFARNLKQALPNAVRIGFTGTPIEKADRSTTLNFGSYISVYNITRAVEDGATVPIYYENRSIPIEIEDPSLLIAVEEALQGEDEEAANELIKRETKLDRVFGSSARIETITSDIAEHLKAREADFRMELDDFPGGKALVVGMTRRICCEMTDKLREHFSEEAVTCVISASATDDLFLSRFRRNKQEMKDVAKEFKDPDSDLKIVVVQNMWLTGFDVPALHTMYLDRPMKDHGLLQAIARVNRVFRDKPGGLIVDYSGIGEDLRAALPAYSKDDVEGATVPLKTLISKLKEKHEVLSEFFHNSGWEKRGQMNEGEFATLFAVQSGAILKDDDDTKRYLDEHAAFSKTFALVSPDKSAKDIQDDAEWFKDIAAAIRKLTSPSRQVSDASKQAVREFYSKGLAAGEIVNVFELAGKDRPEISVLSDEFLDNLTKNVPDEDLQVAFLRKLLNDEIVSRGRSNKMEAKLFSDQIEDLLLRYKNRQMTSAEVVEALVGLAKKMRKSRHRHEELGLTQEEAAFYDALAGSSENWKADEKLAEIVKSLVATIKADLTVDWTTHEQAESAIRVKVKRLLRKSKYEPPAKINGGGRGRPLEMITDLVLDQARELYKYWPDSDTDEFML